MKRKVKGDTDIPAKLYKYILYRVHTYHTVLELFPIQKTLNENTAMIKKCYLCKKSGPKGKQFC